MDFLQSGKLVAIATAAVFFAGLTSGSQAQTFNGIDGWDYKPVYFPEGQLGYAPNATINGEVGHELWISGPRANCSGGNWQGSYSIVSGELPPGLTMNPRTLEISGVPTERGHWIVTLKDDPLYCGGSRYWGFTQKLFFHIGGSGKVIQ